MGIRANDFMKILTLKQKTAIEKYIANGWRACSTVELFHVRQAKKKINDIIDNYALIKNLYNKLMGGKKDGN